jgi:hypothetical protein
VALRPLIRGAVVDRMSRSWSPRGPAQTPDLGGAVVIGCGARDLARASPGVDRRERPWLDEVEVCGVREMSEARVEVPLPGRRALSAVGLLAAGGGQHRPPRAC